MSVGTVTAKNMAVITFRSPERNVPDVSRGENSGVCGQVDGALVKLLKLVVLLIS